MSSRIAEPTVVASGQKYFLTPADKEQLGKEMVRGIISIIRDDLLTKAEEASTRSEEGFRRSEEGFALGSKLAEEAKIHKAQAEEHFAEAAVHKAKAAAARAEKERITKILSVNIFFGTFHGTLKAALPPVIIERTFERYLDQGRVISVDPDPETQTAFYDAVTTAPFARYLADNPGKVTQCNFTLFRNIMDNMRDVAQILAESTCSVKAVWISSGISGEAKSNLDAAKLARGEALTINYV